MEIVFNLPHVFYVGSNPADNAGALRALLDCQIELNRAYLRRHACPALYEAGVRYGRTQLWEPIPAVLARGYGDCKSLAPWLIAEYRQHGIAAEPTFRFAPNANGAFDFHILVQTATGFEDPSKVLGMGRDEVAKFFGPKR